MSCGIGCRSRLDLALLWLWYRLVAIAPIQPLTWELPYATGVALKKKKEREKKEGREEGGEEGRNKLVNKDQKCVKS